MRKTNRKTKVMKTIAAVTSLGVVMAMAGCGDISGDTSGDISGDVSENEADTKITENTENAESDSAAESVEETETTVCYIAETEKEKALAMQEYIANSLIELAEAEEVNIDIDGGVDEEEIEDTEEEATTESSSGSSGTSSTSSSTSNGSSKSSSGSSSSSNSSKSSSSSSSSKSSSGSSSSSNSSKSSSSSSSSKSSSWDCISNGHSYTSKVTKAPTCDKTGLMTYTCSYCGTAYSENIPATGHTWVEYTYTEEVYHNPVTAERFICGRCSETFDTSSEACEHMDTVHAGQICNYSNYLATISEAYTEYVEKTGYKCSVCGATK